MKVMNAAGSSRRVLFCRKRLQDSSTEADAGPGTQSPVLAFLQA